MPKQWFPWRRLKRGPQHKSERGPPFSAFADQWFGGPERMDKRHPKTMRNRMPDVENVKVAVRVRPFVSF